MFGAASSGVLSKSGVNLTAGMDAYLSVLRAATPASVPITVTSGLRTPEEQASAMLYKLRAKGAQELYSVYRDDKTIAALLKLPATTTAWAAYIAANAPNLSRHMSGGGVDLRTRDLSAAQLSALKSAIAATGGRALVEFDHLHVDLPTKYALLSAAGAGGQLAVRAAKTGLQVWLWGSVALGVLVVGVLANRRMRQGATVASAGVKSNPRRRKRRK